MSRGDNLKGVREATQFPHNDPTRGGRKPSIRKQLEAVLNTEGYMTFDLKDCIIEDEIVKVKVPKMDAIALKLVDWAMSSKGSDSIGAIKMIMEQIDGKPRQTKEVNKRQIPPQAVNVADIYAFVMERNEREAAEKETEKTD